MTDHASLGALRAQLDPAVASRFGLIDWQQEIDSTSSDLLRRATTLPDRALLLAGAQTAGRGRRGRAWQMPPGGNLAMSVFARLNLSPAQLGGLSLALGIACADALHALGLPEVRLKWPNDLLIGPRKLGGLLIEVARSNADRCDVVIGAGVNLCLPVDSDPDWIAVSSLGVALDAATLAARMAEHMMTALDVFSSSGFAAFATRWDTLDAFKGRDVRVLAAGREIHGTALGVAADGALRIACSDGERLFQSADVSLRAP